AAMPSTTTLAAAPTAVALPPRAAPNASAHHSTCADSPPPACTSSATIGLSVATNGMLSTIAETTADPNSSPIVVSSGCPAVASTAALDTCSMTPVWTSAPTMTNSPAKNTSVGHSTSASDCSVVTLVKATSTPAPSSATTDGS